MRLLLAVPLALSLVVALGLSACTTPAVAPTSTLTRTPSPAPVSTCTAPVWADSFPELRGTGMWALIFNKLQAGSEVKIVLRVTGTGLMTVQAHGPNATVLSPAWGPEPHTGSTWERPGDEVGTGWVFPVAGCWTIRVSRGSGTAEVGLRVD